MQNYLEYSFNTNSILIIFHRSGYRLEPWIRNSAKSGSTSLVFDKPYQHFWSLFPSYFILSEKVLKKVCSFEVRIICLTVNWISGQPDIRYKPILKSVLRIQTILHRIRFSKFLLDLVFCCCLNFIPFKVQQDFHIL